MATIYERFMAEVQRVDALELDRQNLEQQYTKLWQLLDNVVRGEIDLARVRVWREGNTMRWDLEPAPTDVSTGDE